MSYTRPTLIKGLSERRRIPRLGKIRLGIKVRSAKSGKECPKETPHFVVPPEVATAHGPEPKELDILFPVDDPAIVAPQAYEFYGASKGLKRICDGEVAWQYNEETKQMEEIECSCEKPGEAECRQRMHLMVILPKVNLGGVYQIDTSSVNSIIDVNSSLDYIRALVGRIAMIPLKLKRVPTETHHDGKKQTHYTLKVELDATLDTLNALRECTTRVLAGASYSLPPPAHENPVLDEADVVEEDEPQKAESAGSPKGKEEVSPSDSIKKRISEEIFPKLKTLGIENKEQAEKLLHARFGIARFGELNSLQVSCFLDFLDEWKNGKCNVRWIEDKQEWEVEYPPEKKERNKREGEKIEA